MKYTIEHIRKNGWIIFESIMGSRAYGTALPTSDTDVRGVFIQPDEEIVKHGFCDQVADEKNDIIFYELSRFMDLVFKNNPNILELLNAPNECVIREHPVFYHIKNSSKKIVSKLCRNTFGGYAHQQIKKSRGYNKKMNWEEDKIVRKDILDFCYFVYDGKSTPVKRVFEITNQDQSSFSLAKVDHARDLYAVYEGDGFVSKEGNQVLTKSIPKEAKLVNYLIFNKDSYSIHCKEWKEYQVWLKERNVHRVEMNKEHGKKYDSKNMMHVYRLLNMCNEIATNGEINVRRPGKEILELLEIRKGRRDYDELLSSAEALMKEVDENFEKSDLRNKPDMSIKEDLTYKVRKSFVLIEGLNK